MNARQVCFFHWARFDRVLLGRWIASLGMAVLALILTGTATALAAGGEQSVEPVAAAPLSTSFVSPLSSNGFYYTVQAGDTLSSIARRYGVTVQAIVQANGIVNPGQIFCGQVFWIPASSGEPTGSNVYVVQHGDTLYSIARRFGVTWQSIASANGLYSPYTIYVGQRLVIPGSGTVQPPPSQRVHIVRRGETLWSIALYYGTTPWAIADANRLFNLNFIYVGQRLVIP